MRDPTKPDIEKVHQVRIRYCIVVGRIRDNEIVRAILLADCGPHFHTWAWRIHSGSLQMINNSCNPFIGALQSAGSRREGADFSDVPNDRQGEATELVPDLLVDVDPDAARAAVVRLPVHDAR